MREIKFRAWTGEKMCYSDPNLQGSNGFLQLVTIYTGYDDSDEWDSYKFMQCTGLKDCNGQEIYEGDIIGITHYLIDEGGEWDWESKHQVVWGGEDYPAFELKPSLECECNGLSYLRCNPEVEMYSVIGNIYETPELT